MTLVFVDLVTAAYHKDER